MQSLAFTILLEWLALNLAPGADASKALGSPRYAVRQNAAKALERNWPYTDATLRRTAKQSDDTEAAEKARIVRERCLNRCLDNPPWADWPLWDSGSNTWKYDRFPPLGRAISRSLPYYGSHPWENYRDVSRAWAQTALERGYATPTMIRLWFRFGNAVDADYERQRE